MTIFKNLLFYHTFIREYAFVAETILSRVVSCFMMDIFYYEKDEFFIIQLKHTPKNIIRISLHSSY